MVMSEPAVESVNAAARVLADFNRCAVAGFLPEEIGTIAREMLRAAQAAVPDPLREVMTEDDPRIIEAGERMVQVITARAGEDDELVFDIVHGWSHQELLYTFVMLLAAYVEFHREEYGSDFPIVHGISLQMLRDERDQT